MQVFRFTPDHAPALAGATENSDWGPGFFWLDIERSETGWHDKAQPWLKMRLHDRHILDTLNETHPPFYDGTDDYDMPGRVLELLHVKNEKDAPEAVDASMANIEGVAAECGVELRRPVLEGDPAEVIWG